MTLVIDYESLIWAPNILQMILKQLDKVQHIEF